PCARPPADEALDGSSLIGAKAVDGYGQSGASRALTIVINRRVPYPPPHLEGGRNGSVVEFQWSPNKEGDIAGYRVYRQPASGSPVQVCALTQATSCRDTSPPADDALTYFAVAVDKDAQGNLREGQHSEAITVHATNNPPPAPSQLTATSSTGNTVLTWTAPGPDPDPGDQVDHF